MGWSAIPKPKREVKPWQSKEVNMQSVTGSAGLKLEEHLIEQLLSHCQCLYSLDRDVELADWFWWVRWVLVFLNLKLGSRLKLVVIMYRDCVNGLRLDPTLQQSADLQQNFAINLLAEQWIFLARNSFKLFPNNVPAFRQNIFGIFRQPLSLEMYMTRTIINKALQWSLKLNQADGVSMMPLLYSQGMLFAVQMLVHPHRPLKSKSGRNETTK